MATIATTIKLNDKMSGKLKKINEMVMKTSRSLEKMDNGGGKTKISNGTKKSFKKQLQLQSRINQEILEGSSAEKKLNKQTKKVNESLRKQLALQKKLNSQSQPKAMKPAKVAKATAEKGDAGEKGVFSGLASKAMPLIGEGVKKALQASDTVAQDQMKLDSINDGVFSTPQLEGMVNTAAQNSRVPISDMVENVSALSGTGAFSDNAESLGFAEMVNKASAGGDAGASMDAMVASLAQGTMSAENLQAVMNNMPLVASALASELGTSTSGLQELANQGAITSGVIKSAMTSAGSEINSAFGQMPVTFQQVWLMTMNTLRESFAPLLQLLSSAATFIGSNWKTFEPIVKALAVALGILAVIIAVYTVVQWAMNTAMWAWPGTWIIMGIMLLIMGIVLLIQRMGGLKVAWLKTLDIIKTNWDKFVIFIMKGITEMVVFILRFALAWMDVWGGIAKFVIDIGINIVQSIEDMVNNAIKIINLFIAAIKAVTGISIPNIEEVTFAAKAQVVLETGKKAIDKGIDNFSELIDGVESEFDINIANWEADALADQALREQEISDAIAGQQEIGLDYDFGAGDEPVDNSPSGAGGGGSAAQDTADNTGAMRDSMEQSAEELKWMRDLAETEAINRFTTAEIKIEMNNENTISSDTDIDGIVSALSEQVEQAMTASANGVYA